MAQRVFSVMRVKNHRASGPDAKTVHPVSVVVVQSARSASPAKKYHLMEVAATCVVCKTLRIKSFLVRTEYHVRPVGPDLSLCLNMIAPIASVGQATRKLVSKRASILTNAQQTLRTAMGECAI